MSACARSFAYEKFDTHPRFHLHLCLSLRWQNQRFFLIGMKTHLTKWLVGFRTATKLGSRWKSVWRAFTNAATASSCAGLAYLRQNVFIHSCCFKDNGQFGIMM